MAIFTYLFLASLTFLAGLVWYFLRARSAASAEGIRTRIVRYSLLSVGLSLAGLVAFIALSMLAGIFRFGVPQAYDVPGDYLAHGLSGGAILAAAAAGILAPLIVAALKSP